MLDGYHHSGSFCDFLEAIKKTHEVTPETSLHLLEFHLEEQVLVTITDTLLSYTKFPEKKKIKNFQEFTYSNFSKQLPFF